MLGSAPQDQYVALAGLRGVAALLVVQWHGRVFLGGGIVSGGYLAVDFFFLLSGWVLAHAYDARLNASMTVRQFLAVRLIRLYPTYLLIALLVFLCSAAAGKSQIVELLAALILLPNFWVPHFEWLVPTAWSLTAELMANIPFAAAHRWLTQGVLIATVVLSLCTLLFVGVLYGKLDLGWSWSSGMALLPRVAFPFFLGVLLHRNRVKLTRWSPTWATLPSFGFLVATLAFPVSGEFVFARDAVVDVFVLPAILVFAACARPTPVIARAAVLLGTLSYPIYLLHFPAFDAINTVLVENTGVPLDSMPLSFTLPLVLALGGLALLIERYYERPFRRWLSSRAPLIRRPATKAPVW